MFSKLLDKIVDKVEIWSNKTIKKIQELDLRSEPKSTKIEREINWPPPPGSQKINPERLQNGISRLVKDHKSPPGVLDLGFPKELKIKRIIQQELSRQLPQSLKDVSKTIITIEENEMEKVVKVVIDIGPNLADTMKSIANMSSSPGSTIEKAFGPFLLESAKNVVLVLKENTTNQTLSKGEEK